MIIFNSSFINAQFIEDARRYSRQSLEGSARYISMGGAFSALGGDISAITDNPAAAAVFIYPEECVKTIGEERFLVLPHPVVEKYIQYKASDYDGWISGMSKLNERFKY